jgi:D-amino peptidase
MRIYLMTDLEGVAGVLDHDNWCTPSSKYYDLAKRFLTMEVNAAVEGFLDGGAEQVVVADGHGAGGMAPRLLDERTRLQRGWPDGPWPLGLDEGYDACAWVGQHAKSGSVRAHIAHTQGFGYLDLSVNGVSIGEFGQLAMCASELGIRSIFGSGDEAFTEEAQGLVPGIETVAVKRGLQGMAGEGLGRDEYAKWNLAAIHSHPSAAREMIRDGARRSMERFAAEEFGLIPLSPPFERVAMFREDGGRPRTVSRERHPSSFAALMNLPFNPTPLEG